MEDSLENCVTSVTQLQLESQAISPKRWNRTGLESDKDYANSPISLRMLA